MPYNIAYVYSYPQSSTVELTSSSMVSDNFYPQPGTEHKYGDMRSSDNAKEEWRATCTSFPA